MDYRAPIIGRSIFIVDSLLDHYDLCVIFFVKNALESFFFLSQTCKWSFFVNQTFVTHWCHWFTCYVYKIISANSTVVILFSFPAQDEDLYELHLFFDRAFTSGMASKTFCKKSLLKYTCIIRTKLKIKSTEMQLKPHVSENGNLLSGRAPLHLANTPPIQ